MLIPPLIEDFMVTIPFSFLAQRPGGVRMVLWANLVPRVFMSAWALVVGMYLHIRVFRSVVLLFPRIFLKPEFRRKL